MASPHLVRGSSFPTLTGILMFPAMLLGPSLSGVLLTGIVDGRAGLRDLFARMLRCRVPLRWYASLLIPPILVLTVLLSLATFNSPSYTPNRFLLGILFGIPAGFLEEIGWSGFAFPKMRLQSNALTAATVVGLLWGVWHVPVVSFLGAAAPHGAYWLPFALVFIAAMTAMRILVSWIYSNTRSVLLCQLMHVASTGALVIFSPRVTPRQEVVWYGLYAGLLWLAVAAVVWIFGTQLTMREPR